MSVASLLSAIYQSGRVPLDLLISYSDLHGLWGGTSITIRGDGTAARREQARGRSAPELFETKVDREQLLALVNLLIELTAWAQQTPERQPVPDESRATLTISGGGVRCGCWEHFNDMVKIGRLLQIKTKMCELAGPPSDA